MFLIVEVFILIPLSSLTARCAHNVFVGEVLDASQCRSLTSLLEDNPAINTVVLDNCQLQDSGLEILVRGILRLASSSFDCDV